MLQDASVRSEDAPTPNRHEPRDPLDDTPRRGRKFHHLRSVPMRTSDAEAQGLIRQYGKLVRMICNEPKYTVHRQTLMDQEDMYSIGCTIMIQSVEIYEEGRGTKLSTWIAFRVRQGLMCVVKELHGTLRECGGRAASRTARGEEVARARGSEPAARIFLTSLDAPINLSYRNGRGASGDENIALLDTVRSEDDPADETLEAHQQKAWLLEALKNACSPIERDIVLRTLAGEPGQSIGDRHGVTRQRVDQLHQSAIEKLCRRRRLEEAARERIRRAATA